MQHSAHLADREVTHYSTIRTAVYAVYADRSAPAIGESTLGGRHIERLVEAGAGQHVYTVAMRAGGGEGRWGWL